MTQTSLCAVVLMATVFSTVSDVLAQNRSPQVSWTIYPAKDAASANRLSLLPTSTDGVQKNAAELYIECLDRLRPFTSGDMLAAMQQASSGRGLSRDELRKNQPLDQLIQAEGVYELLEQASRCEKLDWEAAGQRSDKDFQPNILDSGWIYSSFLAARARKLLAHDRFDEALQTMQVAVQLDIHFAKHPAARSIVESCRMSSNLISLLENLSQSPESPSLNWAISRIPNDWLDAQAKAEQTLAEAALMLPELNGIAVREGNIAYWNEQLADIYARTFSIDVDREVRSAWAKPGIDVFAIRGYPIAKRRLISQGLPMQQLELMPVAKVLLLDAEMKMSRNVGKFRALIKQPYPEAADELVQLMQRVNELNGFDAELMPISRCILIEAHLTTWFPWSVRVRLARLQLIEAVRLYLATHQGEFPPNLEAITEAIVPLDPFTNKQFLYTREDDHIILANSNKSQPLILRLGVR